VKCIDGKYIPLRPPVVWTVACWLLCDRFDYPHWLCWPLGILCLCAWLVWIYWLCAAEHCEPVLKCGK
jgi:hypothetical protein